MPVYYCSVVHLISAVHLTFNREKFTTIFNTNG